MSDNPQPLNADQLDALPVGSIVVDNEGDEWKRTSKASRMWQCQTGGDDSVLDSDELVAAYVITLKPQLRQRPGDQPLPTASVGPPMHRLAKEELDKRMAIGEDRYGQPLQAMNGRDAVRDVIEELADGLAYAMQVREERRLLREELTALRGFPGVRDRIDSILNRYFPEEP